MFALSGNDVLIVNGRNLTELADGDFAVLRFPNEVANVKTGKNGNAVFGLNESGKQFELDVRVVRGGLDDKFLNNLLVQMLANFQNFPLMSGEFIKQVGNGLGGGTADTYVLSGMVFRNQVDAKGNVEGDSEQSVSIYRFRGASVARAMT